MPQVEALLLAEFDVLDGCKWLDHNPSSAALASGSRREFFVLSSFVQENACVREMNTETIEEWGARFFAAKGYIFLDMCETLETQLVLHIYVTV
ncbi:hypothetical protein Pint_15337 [Pistacia integerrima]|uniref:Uncharacterized protein n=1 Tax=Pistacia integerrima TaxID=434235 RepID=A0ACC0ZFX1_9ROSI|nr:hypothetical protein Pint_15337 [Pistacia integerrima]